MNRYERSWWTWRGRSHALVEDRALGWRSGLPLRFRLSWNRAALAAEVPRQTQTQAMLNCTDNPPLLSRGNPAAMAGDGSMLAEIRTTGQRGALFAPQQVRLARFLIKLHHYPEFSTPKVGYEDSPQLLNGRPPPVLWRYYAWFLVDHG